MIRVGVSTGFGKENRYELQNIPPDIQLACYKYDLYKPQEERIISTLKGTGTNVLTVHLPLDAVKRENPQEIIDMIELHHKTFGCTDFVIHPNKGFKNFMFYYFENTPRDRLYHLCIETFQWRTKKELRSPLEIMEYCIRYPDFRMCIDTSHIEETWFDYKIMYKLLQFTSVIHLSNRAKGVGQHMPFNSEKGELNLVGFVRDLKHRYNWNGKIILEYMAEYQDKIQKNANYVKRLVE
jgi:hypothetical protein